MSMTLLQRSASPTDRSLLPLMASVFAVFLVTGAALPALPLHIHEGLGYGPFIVGLATGAQFAASLLSRLWSGSVSDRHGPKRAVSAGLVMAAFAGLFYLLSLLAVHNPVASVAILLVGRALLGGAESFIMTGAQSWCLALAGPGNAGKMIAWIGTAMFVALAIGSPLGSFLYENWGFASIGLATSTGALITLALVMPIPAIKPIEQGEKAIATVLKAVWLPGTAMAFAGLAYGVMTSFVVLLFVQRGWQPAWLPFTAFAVALMVARIFFGAVPDRLGGARAAMIFVVIQSAGIGLIWIAPVAWVGFTGAAIAGFGYALVYPGFGMEAVSRAPAASRGLAMGVYSAFFDLSLGVLSPMLGLIANVAGIGSIFLITALLGLCAFPIAVRLLPSHHHHLESKG
ncbi:arabinose transporter [Brucella grignonensis]|nr:arabinose transporter [Brucella grignonensis]